jgi:hypothetical protein
MKTAVIIVGRILAFPFVTGIVLVRYSILTVIQLINFARYGGEYIGYMKNDRHMINDIYQELKSQRNTEKQ